MTLRGHEFDLVLTKLPMGQRRVSLLLVAEPVGSWHDGAHASLEVANRPRSIARGVRLLERALIEHLCKELPMTETLQ